MGGYFILPLAWNDVDEAADIILDRDPGAVEVVARLYDAVEETAGLVAQQPQIYTRHPFYDETAHLRRRTVMGFSSYTMYFKLEPERIVVVAILHGASEHGRAIKDREQ